MQVRQLQTEEIKEVYEQHLKETFPEAELKPFWKIKEAICLGVYQCYGLFKRNHLLSYAFFMSEQKKDGALLLDYFASLPQYRNQGYGSIFLQKLDSVFEGQNIFAEVEAPESACPAARDLCKHRIAFYQRNDFADTGIHCKFYGVHYKILLKTSKIISELYAKELLHFYERMYHKRFPRSKLRFWKQRKRRESRYKNDW